MKQIRASEMKSMPWKNGAGVTTEIAIHPANATFANLDFDWRISRAEIRADGPFSIFPGYDRALMILGPDALVTNGVARQPLRPFVFAGEEKFEASLSGSGGHTFDLGVIFRRGLRCELRLISFIEAASTSCLIDPLFRQVCLVNIDGVYAVAGATLNSGDACLIEASDLANNELKITSRGAARLAMFLLSTSEPARR